ncbi:MAG: sigma-54 dependent transcriptional regulator [Pseudomonadota bacterium]
MAKQDAAHRLVESYRNLKTVLSLRDLVRRLWRLDLCLVDLDGLVLDPDWESDRAGCNPVCHICLSGESEAERGHGRGVGEILEKLSLGNYPRGGLFEICRGGLKTLAAPLLLEGRIVGALVSSSFATEPTSRADASFLSPTELRYFFELVNFGLGEIRRYHGELADQRGTGGLDNAWVDRHGFHDIVGRAPAMQRLYHLLDKLGESESTLLIQGENGTGKEMVAKAIHLNSLRRARPFVSQSCSAFNENLLESELFGHVKGSFTGAIRDKKGLFEVADGGTFFMDEVGEMSATLQVKLLRFLQDGTFTPVGGTQPKKVNVRIIAATHRDLRKMVDEGRFREDLFYRINVINIQVPALRERRADIPLLTDHFLKKYAHTDVDREKQFADEAMDALVAYNWPGNVRQLENEVQRAMVMAARKRVIEHEMLSVPVLASTGPSTQLKLGGRLRDTLEQVERQVLLEGLRRVRWNKSRLSRELGICRATLIGKVEKYGLTRESRT